MICSLVNRKYLLAKQKLCLLSHALGHYSRVELGLGEESIVNKQIPLQGCVGGHVTKQAMCLPFASINCGEEDCF